MTRELYWAGFGFQIWCQLLTQISRTTRDSLLIVDEPEIYLHPDVQRQLLGILREPGPDILMATHSGEIMSEADPTEIVLVDKGKRSAQRLRDIEAVQGALDAIGSMQNVTLTQLARNRRILFVEGLPDFRLLRRFARRAGFAELAGGLDFTPAESEGFGNWKRVQSVAWGMKKTLGEALRLGAVFDPDYRPDEETAEILADLRTQLDFAVIHDRKEMENYLLVPTALQRALERAVADRAARSGEATPHIEGVCEILESITEDCRPNVQAQMIDKRLEYFQRTGRDRATITAEAIRLFEKRWEPLENRMQIVPGKQTLKALRSQIQDKYSVTLTDTRIIDSFRKNEIPNGVLRLLDSLEQFRTA